MTTPDITRLQPDIWRGRPVGPGAFLLLQEAGAAAWGVVMDGQLLVAMQTQPALDGLAIALLWVPEGAQGQALAARFLHIAREQQRMQRLPVLSVDVVPALAEAFAAAGYVREGTRWTHALPRMAPLGKAEVVIRAEMPGDDNAADAMVRESFWNRYRPGCDEHLLTHRLRTDEAYLPELSRIALVDGRIASGIWYAKAQLKHGADVWPVALFGPLAVAPEFQRRGLGAMLVEETLPLVKAAGWPGVVIMGDPAYYHRFGFGHAQRHGIVLPDGSCPTALMSLAYTNAGLCKPGAVFMEPTVFSNLSPEDVLAFDRQFPPKERFWLPCQF